MKKIGVLLFAIVAWPLSAQVNLSSSLTACYAFSGNANDAINALNGTVYSSTQVADRNSIPNSAYQFSGVASDYIVLPNNPLLKSTSAVSGSCWVKINNFLSDDHIIFTKNNSASSFAAYSLITYNTNGIYKFRTYKENGTTNYAESLTTPVINTWYHVVFTIDNVSLKIYVNGVLENTAASTMNFDYQADKAVILGGTNESNYNTPFNGAIDNLRFYNRVLNAQEVMALYTLDPPCKDGFVGIRMSVLENGIKVYPNPTHERIYVSNINSDKIEYEILDVLGQQIVTGKLNPEQNSINLAPCADGVYFLRVKNEAGLQILKVIKE
jgi:hypothetical protein